MLRTTPTASSTASNNFPADLEAIIAGGRVAIASPACPLRELFTAVAGLERAPRAVGGPADGGPGVHDAVALWQAIVAGRWSLVAQIEHANQRCFVARRNGPSEPAGASLSEREHQIASYASRGHSNKLIANQLGLCSSTVATQLTSAARKLGLASRESLLHAFTVLGRSTSGDVDPGAPCGADGELGVRVTHLHHDGHDYAVIQLAISPNLPASLTAAEREVATLVVAGLSNAAIAARRHTSVRTVANQLRTIFTKLAIGSRRQLCSRYSIQ